MFSNINIPPAKTVVSTAASVAASAMVIRSIAQDLLPFDLRYHIFMGIKGLVKYFSSQITLIIEEIDGLASNQIYRAAKIYLSTKVSSSTQTYRVSLPDNETKISISMAKNQEVIDIFQGIQFKWRQVSRQVEAGHMGLLGQSSRVQSEIHSFELSFHKKHKEMVLDIYFPFILKQSKSVKEERKTLKLHTLDSDHMRRYTGDAWRSIKLDHPATFDTLAMDLEMKKTIIDDLERFVKRKDYYRRVGKAWKRGYLLYGPTGTGKSSLVAAMANHLNFDIYDLELTSINTNSELRRLLIATGNRSILVVEDIDCSIELQDRQGPPNPLRPSRASQVTLSGLLNFIDGLWSSCGDERIVVFTTNHKDRVDPALLRPGRMDVHIHMSYCSPCGFTTLAANYIGITDHSLFFEIAELLLKIPVTPAEVGGQLLKNDDPDTALSGLIGFLKAKKRENYCNIEEEKKKCQEESSGGEAKD
ncbi:AAA-ATPase [Quillaja saponaria]|uniref:AAA-ATPase n=1 Tax=Quillaja saponaria TaxID=32244 RepID=A0AAD7LZS1_QUISA|nr:AAA-ATPase [Quillaja saponaria]